jgi:hypothetical protein
VADILDEAADKAEDGDFFGAMAVLEEASEDLDSEVRQGSATSERPASTSATTRPGARSSRLLLTVAGAFTHVVPMIVL